MPDDGMAGHVEEGLYGLADVRISVYRSRSRGMDLGKSITHLGKV